MKKEKLDLTDKIVCIGWTILAIIVGITLIIIVYMEETKRNEKECWDYYLKNKVILKSCEKWIKEEEK